MKLPIVVSSPHAGWRVPPEAKPYCKLTLKEIAADGDEGAREIYDFRNEVALFLTTEIARAIVDLNRAETDFSKDGVIKTHTCWDVPVYETAPPYSVTAALIDEYYSPYHQRLSAVNGQKILLGVDCHTMAAKGPPVGPDPDRERPRVCLSDCRGKTVPEAWMKQLTASFESAFQCEVHVNDPFTGGYITQKHGKEMPWVQLEISRAPFGTNEEKRAMVLKALSEFCAEQSKM